MKLLYRLAFIFGLVFLVASTASAEEKKVNLGVSIPAATHGWTGGVVYWANQAKKDLEKEASRTEDHCQDGRGALPNKLTNCRTFSRPPRSTALVVLPF